MLVPNITFLLSGILCVYHVIEGIRCGSRSEGAYRFAKLVPYRDPKTSVERVVKQQDSSIDRDNASRRKLIRNLGHARQEKFTPQKI